jgi:predicted nucleic acid-binding protein
MMVVVCDTSPINYLLLIRQEGLLRRLSKSLLIPPAVLSELCNEAAPAMVREWAKTLPPWVEVREPKQTESFEQLGPGGQARPYHSL